MKTFNKKISIFQIIAILGISMLFSLNGKSAEFVIINDTISYPNATDNNGFYFFYWNSSMPINWKSPVDYYNGQVYTRYEIITQVTSEPIGFQFGVWMKLPPVTGTLYEDMESVRHLNGPGTFITSNSSPSSWWKFNGGSDFTQMNNVWHFGINPYKVDPFEQQIRSENAATWAERFTLWFPMTVRVTVVAVSSGATFSGWDNYTKFATPAYTINYSTEKTSQIVPSTDEYSYSPSMTPAYSGTGAQLSLTPGQTVYFRTKAKDNTPQSNIQTLTVPARPSITAFSIDYTNVRTNEVVSSNVVYSTASDFSSPTAGTGERVILTPGQDLYLKINSTASTFASQTIHLVVPAKPDAPTVNINYVNEATNEVLSSTVEYAVNVNMTGAVSCANDEVTLTPGTDLYFRYKPTASSFASSVTTLDVPSRPATPAITINYSTELSSVVGTTLEWSLNESFSTATQGQNAGITLTPGANVYIRVKATSGSFSSAAQLLVVPSRPTTPNITINYENEKTSAVGSTLQWSLFSSMSAATDGQGTTLSLTPGTDLYFRVKGTASSFTSGVQHLDVPSRPLMPVFTINYIDESTNEVVSQNVEYSVSSGFLSVNYGSGAELELIPGTDLFFRQKNTASSFRSAASELVIPERNILGYSGNDTVNTYFTMYAIIFDESFEFSLNSLSIANAVASNLRDGNIFDIHPATMGDVRVKIPASPTCFESNEVKVYYNGPTAINQPELAQVNIFPNPVSEGIIHIDTFNDQPFTIEVISAEGKILKRFENYGSENNLVDLSGFSSGLYLIKIYFTDQVSINKIFIE